MAMKRKASRHDIEYTHCDGVILNIHTATAELCCTNMETARNLVRAFAIICIRLYANKSTLIPVTNKQIYHVPFNTFTFFASQNGQETLENLNLTPLKNNV